MADFRAPRGGLPSITEDPIWCVRAYERLWRPDAPDAAVDQLLAIGFVAHTPAGKDTGRGEFRQLTRSTEVVGPRSPGTPVTSPLRNPEPILNLVRRR